MKLIVALIQPSRLEALKSKLSRWGINGMTVSDTNGPASQTIQKENSSSQASQESENLLIPKVKVEIVVDSDVADVILNLVVAAARNGQDGTIGDGKVFMLPLNDAVRMRTGEIGSLAL